VHRAPPSRKATPNSHAVLPSRSSAVRWKRLKDRRPSRKGAIIHRAAINPCDVADFNSKRQRSEGRQRNISGRKAYRLCGQTLSGRRSLRRSARLKSPFNQRSAADLEASGIKNDGGPRVCHRYLGRDANFLNQAKATGTARIVLSCASVSGKPSRFP
jgi:hypothetical protein